MKRDLCDRSPSESLKIDTAARPTEITAGYCKCIDIQGIRRITLLLNKINSCGSDLELLD